MTVFIYLGPTMSHAEARAILDAQYLPPVAMGELYTLVETSARPGDTIAIIDGVFEQVPAVWHKEILYALEKGMHVYGASSMGALRAAELHTFGMKGVGRIFEAYRDGQLTDDDDVAVAHATEDGGFRSLSHAMVSLRFGLEDLLERGVLAKQQHDALIEEAKGLHYSERSWAAVYSAAKRLGFGANILEAIRNLSRTYDAKAADARSLLKTLAEQSEHAPYEADFVMERTAFWIRLTQEQASRIAKVQSDWQFAYQQGDESTLRYVRAAHPERGTLLQRALLLKLAQEATRGVERKELDIKGAARSLAHRNGLIHSAEMAEWRRQQALEDDREWMTALELEARCLLLLRYYARSLDPFLTSALKLEGEYGDAYERALDGRNRFGENKAKSLSLDETELDADALQAWYVKRCGLMHPSPEEHAHALGFDTLRDFISEVLATYLLEEERGRGGREA